jgi:hypothetical protein
VQAVQSHADTVGILGTGGREGAVVFFCASLFLFYVVKMPQGRANNHTSMHPQQTRDRKKALVKRKKPVRVYQRPDVGLKEIERKGIDLVPRSANYSRIYRANLGGWGYAPGRAMPRLLR